MLRFYATRKCTVKTIKVTSLYFIIKFPAYSAPLLSKYFHIKSVLRINQECAQGRHCSLGYPLLHPSPTFLFPLPLPPFLFLPPPPLYEDTKVQGGEGSIVLLSHRLTPELSSALPTRSTAPSNTMISERREEVGVLLFSLGRKEFCFRFKNQKWLKLNSSAK